mgnify:CR=1 FL=1
MMTKHRHCFTQILFCEAELVIIIHKIPPQNDTALLANHDLTRLIPFAYNLGVKSYISGFYT